jgi:peptide chain release factor subunit 3
MKSLLISLPSSITPNMSSKDSTPENWEDDAEEVTAEEAKTWEKETVYTFKPETTSYSFASVSSSLLNMEEQVSQHYSNQKDQHPSKDPSRKKEPREIKEKKEEILEKLDKNLLITKYLSENPSLSLKKPLNVVLVGHVDAGKSTLCGNLMLKTERIESRVVEMYESEAKENGRDSWWLAYIMDVIEEEREKGITIEVGKAFLETKNKAICLLDAPGHRSFVPNMVMAAAQADIAALVVSARPGEFESGFSKGGQTTEHILICRSMGIDTFVVLVNKMDTVDWSLDRFEHIKNTLSLFLVETCKIDPSLLFWIPVSGLEGLNLMEKYGNWYQGLSFLDLLDSLITGPDLQERPLRVPILDKSKENGTILIGKVETGTILKGMKACLQPGNLEVEVVDILGAEDLKIPFAVPGMNLRVRVKGGEEATKGLVLCDPYDFPKISDIFVADVWIIDLPSHNPLCLPGYSCMIHIGVNMTECTIEEVLWKFDQFKKKKVKTGFLRSGDKGTLKIKLRDPCCIARFDEVRALGRFALRDEDLTVGLGKITH